MGLKHGRRALICCLGRGGERGHRQRQSRRSRCCQARRGGSFKSRGRGCWCKSALHEGGVVAAAAAAFCFCWVGEGGQEQEMYRRRDGGLGAISLGKKAGWFSRPRAVVGSSQHTHPAVSKQRAQASKRGRNGTNGALGSGGARKEEEGRLARSSRVMRAPRMNPCWKAGRVPGLLSSWGRGSRGRRPKGGRPRGSGPAARGQPRRGAQVQGASPAGRPWGWPGGEGAGPTRARGPGRAWRRRHPGNQRGTSACSIP